MFAVLRAQLPAAHHCGRRTDAPKERTAFRAYGSRPVRRSHQYLGYMGHSTKVFADPSHGWVVNSVAHPLCVGERQRRFLDRNPPVEPI
jgi:hypothetical protein